MCVFACTLGCTLIHVLREVVFKPSCRLLELLRENNSNALPYSKTLFSFFLCFKDKFGHISSSPASASRLGLQAPTPHPVLSVWVLLCCPGWLPAHEPPAPPPRVTWITDACLHAWPLVWTGSQAQASYAVPGYGGPSSGCHCGWAWRF